MVVVSEAVILGNVLAIAAAAAASTASAGVCEYRVSKFMQLGKYSVG